MRALLASLLLTTAAVAACGGAPRGNPSSAAARTQALRDLVAEEWEYSLRTSPETASSYGDRRYNAQWSDYSDAGARADIAAKRDFLRRLAAIDPAGLPEQDQITARLLAFDLQLQVDGERFESWLMPVSQIAGPQVQLPTLVPVLPFETTRDYDDYIARLRAIPTVFDQTTADMRLGMTKHLMPPKVLVAPVPAATLAIAAAKPEDSPFAAPIAKFSDAVPEADRARIRADVLAAIRDRVDPAFAAFGAFVRDEYAPHARDEVGEWALPDGTARYELDIAVGTTTHMNAEEIHQLGLREVARIEVEMLATVKKLRFADLHAFSDALAHDPVHHFHSRDEVLAKYRGYIDGMYPHLPELFGRLPKQRLEVVPVEPFREATMPGALYWPGAPDGSRPGRVYVNTGAFETRGMQNVETTAYHEGVPGHHMQLTIAQEMTDLPPYRQHWFSSAYAEGWALYSERLGEELGLYQDPYSYYGHLQDEMLRAIRLVVDTGMHAKHWSRQQVVDFFHAHSTSDEVEVQTETDRYIAWPGQALSYKIGQLKILELRERAKRELGAKFDLRAFHDTVLGAGALPLDVLEARVGTWIAAQRR